MIKRFCLYGFLKNQRYFEPFFLLFLASKGLNFTQIGLLIGIREFSTAILEIPSGSCADLYGRKKSMLFSFSAYIVSFLLFYFGKNFYTLLLPIIFFALGDAFRTGTHKAMIFSWLKKQNRSDERKKIYGLTRSWSKIGSAVSIPISASLVFFCNDYNLLFIFCIIPYLIGLINFYYYPNELDFVEKIDSKPLNIFSHTQQALKNTFKEKKLRGLIIQSMTFECIFSSTKDYLQPILVALAVSLPFFKSTQNLKDDAIIIGVVYFLLHVLSAISSQQSHKLTKLQKDDHLLSMYIWFIYMALYTGVFIGLLYQIPLISTLFFVGIYTLQNVWRPLLIARMDELCSEKDQATILSIESQTGNFAAMLLAPFIGFCIDYMNRVTHIPTLLPVAAIGILLSSIIILVYYRNFNSIKF